jgi:hypothetical protein
VGSLQHGAQSPASPVPSEIFRGNAGSERFAWVDYEHTFALASGHFPLAADRRRTLAVGVNELRAAVDDLVTEVDPPTLSKWELGEQIIELC